MILFILDLQGQKIYYCINENQVQRQMKDLMNFPLAVYLFSLVCNTYLRFLMSNTEIHLFCKFSI